MTSSAVPAAGSKTTSTSTPSRPAQSRHRATSSPPGMFGQRERRTFSASTRTTGGTMRIVAARIRIGTCSFADEALTKHWYPPGVRSSEQRLAYYAQHFDTTEVDSTLYTLATADMRPNRENCTTD